MHLPRVYIIILNYRQWQDTRDCLESIFTSDYSNYSVIVVDNASGNDSIGHLAGWMKERTADEQLRVQFIQNELNEGFAKGNNKAIRLLLEEDAYIWLLNPDMTIEPKTLPELVNFAGKSSPKTILGATVLSGGNRQLFFYGGGSINFWSGTIRMNKRADNTDLDYISGGCLFTHARHFVELGLLPEEYFLYWEETDWCYQAKKKGYELRICSEAICHDKVSTVIGKGFLSDYYYSRNGLLFIHKYRPGYLPFVLSSIGFRWAKRMLSGKWDRARGVRSGAVDFLKGRKNAVQ